MEIEEKEKEVKIKMTEKEVNRRPPMFSCIRL